MLGRQNDLQSELLGTQREGTVIQRFYGYLHEELEEMEYEKKFGGK